jgi:NhaP-type Na+/H+ or K+/H+ antiporter
MIGVFLGLLVYWLITWIRDRGKPKESIEEIERVSLID